MISVESVKEGDTVTIWVYEREEKELKPRKATFVRKYPHFYFLVDEYGMKWCPKKMDFFMMLNNLTESAYLKMLRANGR